MIYPGRESRHLEFKSKLPSFAQLVKTCVAFANGSGGQIIIGIQDATREIIGIDDDIRNKIYDEFSNSLYDSTNPGLIAEIYEKNFGNENVLIIEIPAVMKKPVFIKTEGLPKGVYLRAGSSTRRANEECIEELMRENKRLTYDEEAIQESIDVLSEDLINKVYPKASTSKLLSEKVIVQSTISSKKYYPTVAGVLWFCSDPNEYIPEAHILCTQFSGINGRNIIQTQEIGGSLKDQIEDGFYLIRSWLLRNFSLKGTALKGEVILPEVALREAIINAVVHRKYSIPGAIKIALFEDRLEIFSPGSFPGLVDINNLGDGTTYFRNPVIGKIARRMEYIEKLGSGINVIFASCKIAGLKAPEFYEGADSVKIIFYFLTERSIMDSDEENILKLFSRFSEVTISDIMKFLNVSRNTATRKLSKLLDSGKIDRTGKGPAVKYRLASTL